MGIGAAASEAPVPLVRTSWPPGVGPATHQGCRSLGKGNFALGGVAQRERRRGRGPDAEGVADMLAGRCSGNFFLGIAKGLWNTRWMPEASCPSSNIWRWYGRSGVTPKRAPIPTGNERAYGRPLRFGQGMGWLARKRYSRVGPGPRAMVWLVLRSIQGWRLPALRYAVRPYGALTFSLCSPAVR